MNWNWEPNRWKKSTRILLGIATVWPPIYMVLFFGVIIAAMFLIPFAENRSSRSCREMDLMQLDRKIKSGELTELRVSSNEIIAIDRAGKCNLTYVTNESSREEIVKEARGLDENGKQRVPKIEQNTSRPALSPVFPLGFVALFVAHMITILLMIGLMPLYIILAVKDDRLDQTMRIIWVVLICMMGMLAMPVYWYLYVWRDQPPTSSLAGQSV